MPPAPGVPGAWQGSWPAPTRADGSPAPRGEPSAALRARSAAPGTRFRVRKPRRAPRAAGPRSSETRARTCAPNPRLCGPGPRRATPRDAWPPLLPAALALRGCARFPPFAATPPELDLAPHPPPRGPAGHAGRLCPQEHGTPHEPTSSTARGASHQYDAIGASPVTKRWLAASHRKPAAWTWASARPMLARTSSRTRCVLSAGTAAPDACSNSRISS